MADITAKIYNLSGKEVGEQILPAVIFGVKVKPELVQQAVVAQQANSRSAIAHTKGRGEVRGGGRKPWKQKGTGRARHGSIRSPLWVGGGVTFGPTNKRNFSLALNKKMKKKALAMVLTDKAAHERLVLIDTLEVPEGKTKNLKTGLSALPSKGKKVLIVTDATHDKVIRAARNLPRVETIAVNSLNVVDLLKNEWLLLPQVLLDRLVILYSLKK
ncbi:MAG: 50S ribosomal protein L4 [Candidatus Komeilibacteria bacterium]